MEENTIISEEYFNNVINPSKIAANWSLEKINLYIVEFNTRLEIFKASEPQYITGVQVNKIRRLMFALDALNFAYIIKETGLTFIPPPSGMSWILNYNINP